MKKIFAQILICLFFCLPVFAELQPSDAEVQDPMSFEISVQPKKTKAEMEDERWLLVMRSETGDYLLDHRSVKPTVDAAGVEDSNLICVLTRSIFKDAKLLEQLQSAYAVKLQAGEKITYCGMLLEFDLQKCVYRIMKTELYTQDERLVEAKNAEHTNWKKISKQSFAEAVLKFLKQNAKTK